MLKKGKRQHFQLYPYIVPMSPDEIKFSEIHRSYNKVMENVLNAFIYLFFFTTNEKSSQGKKTSWCNQ